MAEFMSVFLRLFSFAAEVFNSVADVADEIPL